LLLAASGATYEAIMRAGDAKRYPPPGQLVDVGGYRLHLHCVGQGSPTVVLDPGLGSFSIDARHESVDEHLTPQQVAAEDTQQQRFQDIIKWTARFGLVRLLWAPAWPRALPGTQNLSPETRTTIGILQARPQQIETALAEGQGRLESNTLLSSAAPPGNTPLVVVASSQNVDHLPFWKEAQQIMTGLSSNSRLVVASSGHSVHFEQSALVVESIRQVGDAARTGEPLKS
jgi:hypothetical protein